jgi:hypothetical protein
MENALRRAEDRSSASLVASTGHRPTTHPIVRLSYPNASSPPDPTTPKLRPHPWPPVASSPPAASSLPSSTPHPNPRRARHRRRHHPICPLSPPRPLLLHDAADRPWCPAVDVGARARQLQSRCLWAYRSPSAAHGLVPKSSASAAASLENLAGVFSSRCYNRRLLLIHLVYVFCIIRTDFFLHLICRFAS